MAKISFVILGFLILQLALIQAKRFSKLTHTEVTQSDPFSVATNVLAQYTSAEGWGSFYETPISKIIYDFRFYLIFHYYSSGRYRWKWS